MGMPIKINIGELHELEVDLRKDGFRRISKREEWTPDGKSGGVSLIYKNRWGIDIKVIVPCSLQEWQDEIAISPSN